LTVRTVEFRKLSLVPTFWKPVSNAVSFNFVHGVGKDDCVAEWFFETNWKTTVSPGAAVMLEGLKVRVLFEPTVMTHSAAIAAEAGRRAATKVEKRILTEGS